jgi:peptide/nickel transport system permease protein
VSAVAWLLRGAGRPVLLPNRDGSRRAARLRALGRWAGGAAAGLLRLGLRLGAIMLAVSALTYLALGLLPGNPAYAILGPAATDQAVQALDRRLGLLAPLPVRYWHWLVAALHGNLGYSYLTGQSVVSAIGERLPETLELIVVSQLLAYLVGVPLGIAAALRAGGRLDRLVTAGALGAISLPSFVLGVVLVLVFAVQLRLLPATGFAPLGRGLGPNLRTMLLPALTLAAGNAGLYARVLRAGMIDTLEQPFVLAARARGLTEARVVARHALRPSLTSLVTMSGISIGYLIGGAFVVEYLFQLPGIGLLTVQSIAADNDVMVQGVVVVVSAGFVLVNAAVDALQRVLDPRVAQHGAGP